MERSQEFILNKYDTVLSTIQNAKKQIENMSNTILYTARNLEI